MNFKTGIKTLLFFVIAAVITFSVTTISVASDYQYKVLDPKYNPQAQQLIDGKLPTAEILAIADNHKGFDFGTFFAIFALVVLPIMIISAAFRTYKEFSQGVPGCKQQSIGNIKIEPKTTNTSQKTQINNSQQPVKTAMVTDAISRAKKSDNNEQQVQVAENTQEDIDITATTSNYLSSPIANIPNPMLLKTAQLTKNKGLCLVEYNKKYSLLGYVNSEIFVLKQFEDVSSWEIRSRLSETTDAKDRYIVKLGDYKGLVEVGDEQMELLLDL